MPKLDTPSKHRRKTERLAVRLPADTKRVLERAAAVTGRSLTDFVVDNALAAARRAIADNERMHLAAEDRAVFLAALADPPAPSAALKEAASRYRKLTD